MKKLIYGIILISALWLTGCADAGKDQSVVSGEVVTLDGTASKADFFGEIKKYRWKQVKGNKVTLSDFKTQKPTFTAPQVSKKTTLTFRLVTKEMGGYYSPWKTRDKVTIVVNPPSTENKLPQATATVSSETIKYGESVTFDASASTDSDGEIVSYAWTDAQGGTVGSGVTLVHVFESVGAHTVTLTITDNEGATATATLAVTVNELQKPKADINASATIVFINNTVTFDANASSDSDGEIVSYTWTDAGGNVLSDMVSFTQPFTISGEHNITLSVMDDDEQIGTTTVTITVQAELLSVSLSSEVSSLDVNETTELNATAYYNDDTTVPVSSSVTWVVGDTNILTIDANGTLKALHSGTTSIMAKVGEVESNSISIEVNPLDTTAPTLTLNGEAELTLEVGTSYTELGATVTDDRDENVTMTQTGVVDVNVVGIYTITYTATDKAGNSATLQRTVHVVLPPDVTAPALTLNGESTVTLYQGTNYTELGASAIDDRDGNVSVSISGNVNTATLGSYTVTYTAVDSAGNSATIERTVNVILPPDTVAPIVTLNGESEVTLFQDVAYTELGATATDVRDGDVNVTIVGEVDSSTIGIYTITYTATDKAGNTTTVQRTVNVVLPPDVTPPVITLNGESEVTVFQDTPYTELGATATDVRDGNVSVSVSGSVDISTLGSYGLTYTAVDSAGNSATVQRTVNVVLPPDIEAPVITLNGDVNITLTLGESYEELGASASDERDGDVNVTISGSVDTSTEGTYTMTYTARDKAGNEAHITRTVTVVAQIEDMGYLIESNATVAEGGTIVQLNINLLYPKELVFDLKELQVCNNKRCWGIIDSINSDLNNTSERIKIIADKMILIDLGLFDVKDINETIDRIKFIYNSRKGEIKLPIEMVFYPFGNSLYINLSEKVTVPFNSVYKLGVKNFLYIPNVNYRYKFDNGVILDIPEGALDQMAFFMIHDSKAQGEDKEYLEFDDYRISFYSEDTNRTMYEILQNAEDMIDTNKVPKYFFKEIEVYLPIKKFDITKDELLQKYKFFNGNNQGYTKDFEIVTVENEKYVYFKTNLTTFSPGFDDASGWE